MKDLEKQTGNYNYNYNTTSDSIKLEKQIEEAADIQSCDNGEFNSFIQGAKSKEAKEYWQHTLKIEMIAKTAKLLSEAKKEIKSMYSEEEILFILRKAITTSLTLYNIEEWFNTIKKK